MSRTIKSDIVVSLLEADGWFVDRIKGSHHQYSKGPGTPTVTVPLHNAGSEMPLGTAAAIVRAAGSHIEDAFNHVVKRGGGIKALKRHITEFRNG